MTKEFAKKLGKAINSIGVITRDKKNPFYKSNYADINSILPNVKEELQKVGITCMAIVQNNSLINVFIDQDTGEVFPNIKDNTIGLDIKTVKAQDRGSEITYYRRYLLCSNLLVEQADDDGNQATKKLPELKEGTPEFEGAVKWLKTAEGSIEGVQTKYYITPKVINMLKTA